MFHPEGPTFCELARQALSSTERGYDLLAPKFEFTPFRTPDTLLRPIASLLGAEGSLQSGLDLCCGTGAGLDLLRAYCPVVVGIDFRQGVIEERRRRTAPARGCWSGCCSRRQRIRHRRLLRGTRSHPAAGRTPLRTADPPRAQAGRTRPVPYFRKAADLVVDVSAVQGFQRRDARQELVDSSALCDVLPDVPATAGATTA